MKFLSTFALVGPAALLLAGCVNLEPVADPTRHYVLASTARSVETASGDCATTLVLGPVTLPAHLENARIAVRVGANEVRYSDYHRWAEPLRESVARLLREELAAADPDTCVLPFGPGTPSTFDRQLIVEITRLDFTPEDRARLTANWRLVDRNDRENVSTGAFHSTREFGATPDDFTAGVAALNALLTELAAELADDQSPPSDRTEP